MGHSKLGKRESFSKEKKIDQKMWHFYYEFVCKYFTAYLSASIFYWKLVAHLYSQLSLYYTHIHTHPHTHTRRCVFCDRSSIVVTFLGLQIRGSRQKEETCNLSYFLSLKLFSRLSINPQFSYNNIFTFFQIIIFPSEHKKNILKN